jgi:hypothetical protein
MLVLATQGFRARPLGDMGPLQLGVLALVAMALLGAYASMLRALLRSRARPDYGSDVLSP